MMTHRHYLEKYKNRLQWKDKESIMEFGIGSGDSTKYDLLPYLPTEVEEFVGTDICPRMVEYSKRIFEDDPKVRIELFDIASETIPNDYEERFNHIFSFMVLQLIHNTKRAFENMYKMLKPGGEVFVTCCEKIRASEIFIDLLLDSRWKKYCQEDHLSNFCINEKNVEEAFRKVISEAGFTDFDLEVEERMHHFANEEAFRAFAYSVNPIIANIQDEEVDEYKELYINMLMKSNFASVEECEKTGGEKIHCHYKQFIVIARKPTAAVSPATIPTMSTFDNWSQPDMDKLIHNFQWNDEESILEFGCGCGTYTKNALMHYLPTDFKEFIGSDISPEMVEIAKEILIHPKVRFEVLDIACETIPPQYEERFDHIFSFKVLHTVPNTKRAFQNIFKMLKPGGEAFLTFGERISTHEVFTELHNHPRWKKYRHGDYVADFYHYGDIEAALKRMLQESGFTDHILEIEDTYDMTPSGKCFRDVVCDYNPVLPLIPEKDVEEYKDMFVEKLLESSLYKVKVFKKGSHPLVYYDYKRFVVFARKPGPNYDLMAIEGSMEKYKTKLQWKDEESIMEFGVGDGMNTRLGLVPYFPKNLKEFIMTDLSADMVECAKSNIGDLKTRIEQFDIVSDTIPPGYVERFDHIFSFMVLQLVLNLRKAFRNIFEMLKPGGEVFVTFSEKMLTNEAFMEMMIDRRWEEYGHEDYLTAFHFYDNVEEEFRKVLVETGFTDYDFEIEDRTHDFKNELAFRDYALKVNPVLPLIPAHELEEYKDIFVEKMKNSKLYFVKKCERTGRETFHCRYKQIVLLARKPTPNSSPRGTYKESSFTVKKVN